MSSSSSTSKQFLLPTIPSSLSTGFVAAHLLNVALTVVFVMATSGFRDADEALGFYGVYHREKWNQLIHFFGVPLLVWSLFLGQAHLPLTTSIVIKVPGLMTPHYASWATLWLAMYSGFYLSVDVIGALLYAPILFFFYVTATEYVVQDQLAYAKKTSQKQVSWLGSGRPLQVAAMGQVLAWYVQIHPGHKIFEGARPALFESFGGAISTAPLFAFYEGLWFAGVRADLQQQVLAKVALYTEELCASGVVMRACENL